MVGSKIIVEFLVNNYMSFLNWFFLVCFFWKYSKLVIWMFIGFWKISLDDFWKLYVVCDV